MEGVYFEICLVCKGVNVFFLTCDYLTPKGEGKKSICISEVSVADKTSYKTLVFVAFFTVGLSSAFSPS